MDTIQCGEKVAQQFTEMVESLKGIFNKKNWTGGKAIGMIFAAIVLLTFFSLTITLGIFGYWNPDPDQCWTVKGIDHSYSTYDLEVFNQLAKDLMMDQLPPGYPVEMHNVFERWALWGFWTNMSLIIVFITSILCASKAAKLMAFALSFTGLGWFISKLLWIIFGAIWRFSSVGRVACGDFLQREIWQSEEEWMNARLEASAQGGYQVASGLLMNIIFSLVAALIFIVLFGLSLLGVLMYCCGVDRKEIDKYNMLKQDDYDEIEYVEAQDVEKNEHSDAPAQQQSAIPIQ